MGIGKNKNNNKQSNNQTAQTPTKNPLNSEGNAEKILGFFNFFVSVLITMDSEMTSIKMRRALSAILDVVLCSIVFILFKNNIDGEFWWMYFLIIVGVYFFIEGVLQTSILSKQLTGLKLVIEDFAQEDSSGNKQSHDFEIARLCLRALLKGMYLAIIAGTLCTKHDDSWIMFVGIYWLVFRFTEGSKLPHDILTGTHLDCKSTEYYEGIKQNQVYLVVDKVLDTVFKNTVVQSTSRDVVEEDDDKVDSEEEVESTEYEQETQQVEEDVQQEVKEKEQEVKEKVTADSFIKF